MKKSFDGGRRDDAFLIATMIREFPRNAATDRGMFSAEINILRYIPKKPVEQINCSAVVLFPSSDRFTILSLRLYEM